MRKDRFSTDALTCFSGKRSSGAVMSSEDVAMVKKITVQDAEQDQPHVAPKINIGCPSLSLALLNAAGEQDDARAEEQ